MEIHSATHGYFKRSFGGKHDKSERTLIEHFDELEISLKEIPAESLINYDEINFVNDPGTPKELKVCNSTKSAHSVMFALTAAETMLPQYVIYQSDNLWYTWTQGGPENYLYNRRKSGWFDQSLSFILLYY